MPNPTLAVAYVSRLMSEEVESSGWKQTVVGFVVLFYVNSRDLVGPRDFSCQSGPQPFRNKSEPGGASTDGGARSRSAAVLIRSHSATSGNQELCRYLQVTCYQREFYGIHCLFMFHKKFNLSQAEQQR